MIGPLTECEAASLSYEGWTVGVYRDRVWVVSGIEVDAVEVSRDIGRKILDNVAAPVFEVDDRWVFLTLPHHKVAQHPIDLPPSYGARWITAPHVPLPSFEEVRSTAGAASLSVH